MLYIRSRSYGCTVVGHVFFFKQKTAYDMRISDWSSDVCSSDLPSPTTHTDSGGREPTAERGNSRSECATVSVWRDVWRTASRSDRSGGSFCIALEEVDRKSVVEGKSVSVHVDLGGRSIIKKKKTTV